MIMTLTATPEAARELVALGRDLDRLTAARSSTVLTRARWTVAGLLAELEAPPVPVFLRPDPASLPPAPCSCGGCTARARLRAERASAAEAGVCAPCLPVVPESAAHPRPPFPCGCATCTVERAGRDAREAAYGADQLDRFRRTCAVRCPRA